MSFQGPLSPIADPLSLARLQVLLIPVHHGGAGVGAHTDADGIAFPALTDEVYDYWSKMFHKVQTLRGDEIVHDRSRPNDVHGPSVPTHRRGSAAETPRSRFLPTTSSTSLSRTASANYVHLSYPAQPPAKHLYPLSLLRMSAFPLVVIGVAADDGEYEAEGYEIPGTGVKPKASPSLRINNNWTQTFERTLADFLPPTAAFPLVKRLVLVPSTTPTSGSRTPGSATFNSRSAWIPSPFTCRAPHDGAEGWVTKLMGEVIGQVFGELGELAASLESPAGLHTLSGTLLPSLSATMPQSDEYSASPGPMEAEERLRSPAAGSGSGHSTPRPPSMVHSQSLPVVPLASRSQGSVRSLTPGGRPTAIQAPSAPPIQSAAITAAQPASPASSNPFRRSAALISRSSSASSASGSLSSSLAKDPTGLGKYTTAMLTGIAGGRLLKLLGDMYLLTGVYADAIRCYDEGAERCRAVGDVLWEALAREGRAVAGIGEAWEGRDGSTITTPFPLSPIPVEIMSHYLSALACLTRAPLPFPPTILSPTPQSGDVSISIPGVSAAHPTNIGSGEGLLAYLYATLCLRISHFALFMFAAGGWGSIAVSSLISYSLPRSFPAPVENKDDVAAARRRRIVLGQLALSSQLSRSTILGHAEAALAPFRLAMTKAEQLAVHVEVVWLARWLEMERKEARVTREIIKLVSSVVVEGREEHTRWMSRVNSGLGLGVPIGRSDPQVMSHSVAFRRKEVTEGNAGVMDLIQRVCAALGVEILPLGVDAVTVPGIQGSNELNEPRFGWADLQVETLKEAIAVAENLPDHPSVVRLCLSALHSLYTYLSPANQSYLAKLYPQALSTIRRRAIEFNGIPWWLPGRLVLSVEVSSLPVNRVPFEHAQDEISSPAQGRKDPFLYNPRVKSPEAGKTVLVANEQVDVFVTLQNVFAFDLDIQDLSLLTSGAPFITTPLPLILPASSVQTVRVTGIAPNAGSLEIRGVNVRLVDGSTAEFLLPVVDSAEQKRDSKRRSRLLAETAKTKRQGLQARKSVQYPTGEAPKSSNAPSHRWLQCQVVEEQPLLWIKRTSLTHGTVMLYNGETSTIRITIENTSQVPVDFVKLSFEDSVTREAQAILAEGEVSPEQAYELDFDSLNRPVFTWDNSAELSIPAGGRTTISVQCLGKVGCTDALIRIDYGYVKRDASGVAKTFHTRQLAFPVLFTVYHTLECYSVDLASIRPSESHKKATEKIAKDGIPRSRSGTFAASADDELRSALAQSDERNVLFCMNVRNQYSVPFEVALATKQEGELGASGNSLVVTRLVPPGATERLVLPIQRQSLTQEERARPIPALSGRQYVVQKEKKTADEQQRLRELFWFRERLHSMVEVSWREPGSLRSGHLSLRDQQLTPTQLESFRLDELAITLAVEPRDGQTALSAMDFVDLRITVANNLEREIRPYVRLEALPTNASDGSWSSPAATAPRRVSSLPAAPVRVPKTVAFDGVLAATLPMLAPGDTASHTVGAALLASGMYTFRAAAEEVTSVEPASASFAAFAALPPTVRFSHSVSVDVA